MSRLNMDDIELRRPTITNKLRFGYITKTLAADLTLDADMPTCLVLDPGGAGRKLIMPLETVDANKGLAFFVRNGADAAEDITVRNNADGATIGVISQNECAWLVLLPAVAGAATFTWAMELGATT